MGEYINIFGTGGIPVFLTTFVLVLLAEMGDKSQILVMAFTTRYKIRQVIIGVIVSIILLNSLAVLMGEIITTLIPTSYIQFLASIAFILFGLAAFKKEDEELNKSSKIRLSPTVAVAASFFIAELGDKTQLATMAFAAKYKMPLQVFLGATIAMIIADFIGLIAGAALNKYISPKYIKIVSGVLFMGFGFVGLGTLIPTSQLSPILNSTAIMLGITALVVILLLMFASKKK